MAAETQYTANTGMVAISTANTNLDGTTGSYGTVLTASSTANGTKIKSVTIKAVGSISAQGMVRLFVSGGGSTRLLAEVEIPVITQSATDSSFEQFLEMDLDLKPGYILKASTEKSDTFNIIAEGLDWTYNTSSLRPESTNYKANTGGVLISTANSNLDGTTGTYGTVLTAKTTAEGYNGCRIDSITIKAIVNTTNGMVRLFIQDAGGSSTKLLTEIEVPTVTKSAIARSFVHQINFSSSGFEIGPGYKILASTQNAESFQVVADAMDWQYPSNGENIILSQDFTITSGTATTAEEPLHSHQIAAGVLQADDILEVYAALEVNNNANNKTFRIYVNTSNTLTAATKIATFTATTTITDSIQRLFSVISDTALECHASATGNSRTSYASSGGTSANVTVPSVKAGFWIIISGEKPSSSGDTDTVRWSMVRKNRM